MYARSYVHGKTAYSWIGGQGKIEVPGAEISIQCSTKDHDLVWAKTFAGEAAPTITRGSDSGGGVTLSVDKVPQTEFPRRQTVTSPSNITSPGTFPSQTTYFVASVNAHGDGALSANEDGNMMVCSWQWAGKVVIVERQDGPVTRTEPSDLLPRTLGRSVGHIGQQLDIILILFRCCKRSVACPPQPL